MAATGIQLTLLNWSLFFPKATTLDPVFMLVVCDSEALVVCFFLTASSRFFFEEHTLVSERLPRGD